jgi:peptidoglycan hydrolase-like protein with peptidoglycan-binding domain
MKSRDHDGYLGSSRGRTSQSKSRSRSGPYIAHIDTVLESQGDRKGTGRHESSESGDRDAVLPRKTIDVVVVGCPRWTNGADVGELVVHEAWWSVEHRG